jgi:hypothetical protein
MRALECAAKQQFQIASMRLAMLARRLEPLGSSDMAIRQAENIDSDSENIGGDTLKTSFSK